MMKRCMIVAVLLSWLGASAYLKAQTPPAPGGPPPAYQPVPGQPYPLGTAPGGPGAPSFQPPPPTAGPAQPPPGLPPGAAGPSVAPGVPPGPGAGHPPEGPPQVGGPPCMVPCPLPCPPPPAPILEAPAKGGCLMFFFEPEYLLWWVKKSPAAFLLTTGDRTAFLNGLVAIPGALGNPDTRVLFSQFEGGTYHNGLRVNAGFWLDTDQNLGVQGSFFNLEQKTISVTFQGDGGPNSPILARPFFDAVANIQNADPVNLPTLIAGSITFANLRRMLGGEANMVWNYYVSPLTGTRLSLVAGARMVSLDEKLLIGDSRTQLPDAFGNPAVLTVINEDFSTTNRFYGGQVGGQYEFLLGPVYVQFLGKVAVGQTNEAISNTGVTTQIDPVNGTVTNQTGLLVQPGNARRFTRNEVGVIPEGRFTLGYVFNDNVTLTLGYTGMYWNSVLRPGSHLNTLVNIQPLGQPVPVLPLAPTFQFHPSSFWAQGLSVGLAFNF